MNILTEEWDERLLCSHSHLLRLLYPQTDYCTCNLDDLKKLKVHKNQMIIIETNNTSITAASVVSSSSSSTSSSCIVSTIITTTTTTSIVHVSVATVTAVPTPRPVSAAVVPLIVTTSL